MKSKRKLDLVVISDVHLGTKGCQAKAVLDYLNSIEPKHLILNGDILDSYKFNNNHFPKSHLKVIKKILSMATKGIKVTYITGNRDKLLRKFSPTEFGPITIVDKLLLKQDGKQFWFFHGDVFDNAIKCTKWLAKFGDFGYKLLYRINTITNWFLVNFKFKRLSLTNTIQQSKKSAKRHINNFEKTVTNLAIANNYDAVICGHIHEPKKEVIETENGKTLYLNSGDWIENLTALEYQFKRWKLFTYNPDVISKNNKTSKSSLSKKNVIAAITILGKTNKKKHKELKTSI